MNTNAQLDSIERGQVAVATATKTPVRRAEAFTLVELLVTIAIIAILVGLTMPAVSAARESARRNSCINNLSGLGKAAIAYHEEKLVLPGWRNLVEDYSGKKIAENTDAAKKAACVSWTVTLLPYLDQQEIYDWYETYGATQDAGVVADDVTRKKVGVFQCASAVVPRDMRSPLHYMGNGGTGAETLTTSGSAQFLGDGAFLDHVGNRSADTGTFLSGDDYQEYPGMRLSLSQVAAADGTGSTILFAERSGILSPYDVTWTANPLPSKANANAIMTTHLILHPPELKADAYPQSGQRMINPTAESHAAVNASTLSDNGDWNLRYPSAAHRGGAGFVFCDGHTRFIDEKIDSWVYCQMLTTIKAVRSDRAKNWERPGINGSRVNYIFDENDLKK